MGRLARIQAVYDAVPHVECKGLCHTTCGPIPMERAERKRIAEVVEWYVSNPGYASTYGR